MFELCQRVLNGFGMLVKWALSILVPIIKGKGDIRKCSCYRAVNVLEHGNKVVERVLEKSLRRIVTANEMKFAFCLRKECLMLGLS